MRFAGVLFVLTATASLLVACSAGSGDVPLQRGAPPPQGTDHRIADVTDPKSPAYSKAQTSVSVSGAAVVAVDAFDETRDGKSRGTIYVQDLGAPHPYAGISLFAPTFVPANLRVGPGDVLDLHGPYQENANLGSALFPPGAVLAQLARPVGTFRYEFRVPDPIDIDIADLADFAKGRQWVNMLVRVHDVTVQGDISDQSSGRASALLMPGDPLLKCDAPYPRPPAITNELFDLGRLAIPEGKKLRSLVGVVTFFCNLHIAPRSAADVDLAP